MARMLVVDDSRLTRRLITAALKKADHEVTEAANGALGLEAFRAEPPDAVFSDLLMPEMDGFEMAAAIRAIDPNVPIIIATADIQESSRERCEEIGVTRLVNKPFKAEFILEVLNSVLAEA
jgi:two-component system chemotaxis response regulator CheY